MSEMTYLDTETAYWVIPTDDAISVEVVTAWNEPITVSPFATAADVKAWIAEHRRRVQSGGPRNGGLPTFLSAKRRSSQHRNHRHMHGPKELSRLRKRPLEADAATSGGADEIDIANCATIAFSSEDPGHPVEHMFDGRSGPGATRWISARPDALEHIVVEFDQPQSISRLVYEVEEATRERTQEVRMEVSGDSGRTYRQIFVQEYTFSPTGATYQREEQRFNRVRASHLRLTIVPNKSGSGTATLTALRLFA